MLLAACLAAGRTMGVHAQSEPVTYLEFGKVLAVQNGGVELAIEDPVSKHTLARSFHFSRETRAEPVRRGATVEVIYARDADGNDMVERLIVLRGGVPRPGPAPRVARTPAASTPSAKGTQPVALGNASRPAVPPVRSITLPGATAVDNAAAPRVKAIAAPTVGENCGRTHDWGTEPITLAVLDFRYPTEREESHDVGKVGGGSGTAVADLVYNRLGKDQELAVRRGDRDKVFRMDFAGAARVGRQLGVDAVLLGTFAPVEQPVVDPEFPPAVKAYTLRAGVVETCTGELLYRLVSCPVAPGTAGPPACPEVPNPGAQVTVRQAADPAENLAAFDQPIATLLGPLERDGAPPGTMGSAGVVTAVTGNMLTVRLAPGVHPRASEQVSVVAIRLGKNPTTNTLHVYKHEEVGRLTLTRVAGGTATGSFAGDTPPRVGDTVDILPPE